MALARALAVEPRLLLLDEPLSALDVALRARLAQELRDILREAGTTALLVTHDHEEAFTVADRLAVMRSGRLVQEGPIATVWAHPADPETALFLGYARVLDGAAAGVVRQAAGMAAADPTALAVRRSALVADDTGPIAGTVRSANTAPEQIRLVVDVPGLGEVDAVAPLGSDVPPGALVRLRVDPTKVARVSPSVGDHP